MSGKRGGVGVDEDLDVLHNVASSGMSASVRACTCVGVRVRLHMRACIRAYRTTWCSASEHQLACKVCRTHSGFVQLSDLKGSA